MATKTSIPQTVDELPTETDKQKKARLLQELADMGPDPDEVKGHRPGTIIGAGHAADKVDFSPKDFLDEPRQRVVDMEENVPVTVQGVTFMVYKGYVCFLPESHYQVYINYKLQRQRTAGRFAPPNVYNNQPGYMPEVHIQGVGPLPSRESEGRDG